MESQKQKVRQRQLTVLTPLLGVRFEFDTSVSICSEIVNHFIERCLSRFSVKTESRTEKHINKQSRNSDSQKSRAAKEPAGQLLVFSVTPCSVHTYCGHELLTVSPAEDGQDLLLLLLILFSVREDLGDQLVKVWVGSQRSLRYELLTTCWTFLIARTKRSNDAVGTESQKMHQDINISENYKQMRRCFGTECCSTIQY